MLIGTLLMKQFLQMNRSLTGVAGDQVQKLYKKTQSMVFTYF